MRFKNCVILFILCTTLVKDTLLSPCSAHAQTTQIKLGILGDSGADEYRGDDNRAGGTQYESTTLNWGELMAKYRNISLGTWSDTSRGEPRRKGYEYNWARSGITSQALLDVGEHTGLANQVRNGNVEYVILQIGINDFAWFDFDYFFNNTNHHYSGYYDEIANGQLTGTNLTAFINTVAGNIRTATETILSANPNVKILVVSVTNRSTMSYAQTHYSATQRQRVTDAVLQVNALVKAMTQEKGIAYADNDLLTQQMLARLVNGRYFVICGEQIDVAGVGDEPHNATLGDNEHGGTVAKGMLANWYMENINTVYGTHTPLFTDYELLANAGITPPPSCGNPVTTPTPSPYPPFQIVIPFYGTTNTAYDFDQNGKVNMVDVGKAIKN